MARSFRMKKADDCPEDDAEWTDMLPEYDFTGEKGLRGQYRRTYRRGYAVRVHQEDGRVHMRRFTSQES